MTNGVTDIEIAGLNFMVVDTIETDNSLNLFHFDEENRENYIQITICHDKIHELYSKSSTKHKGEKVSN